MLDFIRDLKLSSAGDLVVTDGDLAQVSGGEWFIQEVMKILRTNNPDWEFHPNVGASLEDFAGQPNVREVGKAIEDRIRDKITAESIQFPGTLMVRVVPLSLHKLQVFITLDINGQSLSVSRNVFDFSNGILRDPTEEEEKMAAAATTSRTSPLKNPYMNRIK